MSENNAQFRLTQFAKASGCGCKIQPAVLKEMLTGISVGSLGNLLVGNDSSDDCSVMDLGDGKYLLQTVDFFTPLVDDAFIFGKAAATNALSDIWAMGGNPIMANAILGWPIDVLPMELAQQVIQGGVEACKEAGIVISGGHSIDSPEPMFGLSVTGLVDANRLKTNSRATVGDCIFITKPLGIGMLAAAHKRGLSSSEQNSELYRWITQSNYIGGKISELSGVHAVTDVTGFGLLGHALEICHASGVSMHLDASLLPKISEAIPLANQFVLPDNAMRNWNAYQHQIDLQNQDAFSWLVDPQTSGGLLVTVKPEQVSDFLKCCNQNDTEVWQIGSVIPQSEKGIVIQ